MRLAAALARLPPVAFGSSGATSRYGRATLPVFFAPALLLLTIKLLALWTSASAMPCSVCW